LLERFNNIGSYSSFSCHFSYSLPQHSHLILFFIPSFPFSFSPPVIPPFCSISSSFSLSFSSLTLSSSLPLFYSLLPSLHYFNSLLPPYKVFCILSFSSSLSFSFPPLSFSSHFLISSILFFLLFRFSFPLLFTIHSSLPPFHYILFILIILLSFPFSYSSLNITTNLMFSSQFHSSSLPYLFAFFKVPLYSLNFYVLFP